MTRIFQIIILSLCFQTTLAHATSTVTSEAFLDWTGARFTTNGTLSIAVIDVASMIGGSTISTSMSPFDQQTFSSSTYPLVMGQSTVQFTARNAEGSVSIQSSNTTGSMESHATASTTGLVLGPAAQPNWAQGTAFTNSSLYVYGIGTGSVRVQIPYRLDLHLDPNGSDILAGSAYARLIFGDYQQEMLSWSEGLAFDLSQSGTLIGQMDFINPTWGPLVTIAAEMGTFASAIAVPEASSLFFLGAALLAVGLGRWWMKDWRVNR